METTQPDFDAATFEAKLKALKDTEVAIQQLSAWCLQRRDYHKNIVSIWLNVLRKVKVEQRLCLFYLANDVIQYSKRKKYEFVESWGTTLQKATPLVRDEKVKHKILRIFKIWEQRSIYDNEFLSDLTGLLTTGTSKKGSSDDTNDFQPTQLVKKIKQCTTLSSDTVARLKNIYECNLKSSNVTTLCANLKQRNDTTGLIKDLDKGISSIKRYIKALQNESTVRDSLCSALDSAQKYYSIQHGEVKVVANAYKLFGGRVRCQKRKLDDLMNELPSRKPKSPSPKAEDVPVADSDSQHRDNNIALHQIDTSLQDSNTYSMDKLYNPATTAPMWENSNINLGFSTFLGSDNPFPFFQDIDMRKNDRNNEGNKIEVINNRASTDKNNTFNISDFFNTTPIPEPPSHTSTFAWFK